VGTGGSDSTGGRSTATGLASRTTAVDGAGDVAATAWAESASSALRIAAVYAGVLPQQPPMSVAPAATIPLTLSPK